MSRRRNERKIRLNELTEQEEQMNDSRQNIIRLKQIKTTSKALFTRTKHKILATLDSESINQEEVNELRGNFIDQQQKIADILTKLTTEYGNINDFDKQENSMEEMEKINDEFNNLMDQLNEHNKSVCSEQMTVVSKHSRRSKSERHALKRREKETRLRQQQKELEDYYQQQKSKLEEEIKNTQQIDQKTDDSGSESHSSSNESVHNDNRSKIHQDYSQNEKVTDWLEKSHQDITVDKEVSNKAPKNKIGQDLWKQLKRVSIPVFNGDKRKYDNWKSAFMACVDEAPATPEYKLLQLRQYLSGDALKAIETLGHSGYAYEAAKERLERKFGGSRRKLMIFMDELENFKPIRSDHPRDIEKFADLLDIAVINLKEAKRDEELGNGTFYRKLQRKLPEKLLAQYQRWIYENKNVENVESLKRFIVQEAEFQVTAAETIQGLHVAGRTKHRGEQSYFGDKEKSREKKSKSTKCVICNSDHPIWQCDKFKQLETPDRWDVAKDKRLCYRCLGTNHRGITCTKTSICGINGCTESHNRLLHIEKSIRSNNEPIENKIKDTEAPNITEGEQGEKKTMHTAKPKYENEELVLRTVPVVLKNGNQKMVVNALLDDGSTKTYINEDVAKELKLEGQKQLVNVSVLNGQCKQFETMPVEFYLESLDGNIKMKVEALTANRVTGDMRAVDWRQYARKWKHLAKIPFQNIGPRPIVDILIGIDYADLHRSLVEVTGKPGEPMARKTLLGWTCIGSINRNDSRPYKSNFIRTYKSSDMDLEAINSTIKKFWEIEEVPSPKEAILNSDDSMALKTVSESLKFQDGKYEVKLPWKQDRYLPNNYKMALRRLENTEKRLKKQPELGEKYGNIIEDYIQKGYLKYVDINPETYTGWYLPHFPIIRPDKTTTKIRIVFDGSAKSEGKSLNDVIHQGPKLQRDLVNVLLRFRRHPVALVCDIAEIYLRIGIHQEDQCYQRILWRSLDENQKPKVLQFNRVVFGINSSPFQAQYVSQDHAKRNQDKLPLAAETVLQSTYMDDSMDSKKDNEEAIKLYEELSSMWASANMHARKWLSNSAEVIQRIPEEDRAAEIDLQSGEFPSVKALGVLWKAKEDYFTFKEQELEQPTTTHTKRSFLKKIAAIFDPLGFLAPYVVCGKMLLQEVWVTGLDWDEPLPYELSRKIDDWYQDLLNLPLLKVPRCLQYPEESVNVSLQVFNDASEKAYGSAVYQRTVYNSGKISARLVMSKSKVAPLQSTSIPRLELMSAVLGLRVAKKVTTTFGMEIRDVTFWCDNSNVLWWIRGMSRNFKPFVANRVSEIQSNSNPIQWRYVPTKMNPSDLTTRGSKLQRLIEDTFWLEGPEFLTKDEDQWPMRKIKAPETSALEEKKSKSLQKIITMHISSRIEAWIVQPSKYSKWLRLVRVNAWIERFIHNCCSPKELKYIGELTAEEIDDAEIRIIRTMQKEEFPDEYKSLQKGKEVSVSSKILHLYPKLDDDGIVRSSGRLQNAEYLSYDIKYPIILPRKNWITRLIVRHHHEEGHHVAGTNQTLSSLSKRYWVLKGREEIRDCENNC